MGAESAGIEVSNRVRALRHEGLPGARESCCSSERRSALLCLTSTTIRQSSLPLCPTSTAPEQCRQHSSSHAMRRVVVTGLGAVTPLGVGVKRTWNSLINSRSGIVSLGGRSSAFDALPSRVAGVVPGGTKADGGWDADEWLSRDDQRRMAVFTQYAMAAAQEAVEDAGCEPATDEQREAMGVCLGSGIGSFEDVYDTSIAYSNGGYKKVSPLFVPRLLINLAAGHVAMKYGLQGPNTAPTTACTTGAHALGDAARLIAHGSADVMLAGAAESCIHPLAIAGFARARSLATAWNDNPEQASRPFDRDRAGFVIGEGAGVVVLEDLAHALARGAPIHAELVGYGLSSDASHMTAPLATGAGAALAMSRALADARTPPAHVGYINAHATSTLLGDAAENRAVRDVLLGRGRFAAAAAGPFCARPADIAVSSTKGAVGHLLGAAGAVEAIFTVLALREGVVPPTLNLERAGPGRRGDGDGGDGDEAAEWDCNYVPRVALELDARVALTNSFGFGGTNASLCFRAWDG